MKKDANTNLNKFIADLPTYLLYFGVTLLLINQFLTNFFSISILKNSNNDYRISIGIAILLFLVMSINKNFKNLNEKVIFFSSKNYNMIEVLQSFESINFKDILENNKNISLLTLSGTKVASLGDSKVKDLLSSTDRKSNIKILLANPFSKAIINRYDVDEPETYEAGLEGIKRRLVWLNNIYINLPSHAQKRLEIKVYDNYPVVSLLKADSDVYSTSYGYRLRGADCPRLHVKANSEYGYFLQKHFDKIFEDAISLNKWLDIYRNQLNL